MCLTSDQLAGLVDVLHPDGGIRLDPAVSELALSCREARALADLLYDGADFVERTDL